MSVTLVFTCVFPLFIGSVQDFVFVLGYSPTSLPAFTFCFFSYYILFRTRQYKQADFTTVSIWRGDTFEFFIYCLYHSTLYDKVCILLPINSILCLHVYGVILFTYYM